MGSRRVLAGIGVAVALHGGVLVALPRPKEPAAPTAAAAEQRNAARAERLRLLRTAEADVAAKRTTFGELMIHLGALDARIEGTGVDAAEEARAVATYLAILQDVRAQAGVSIAQAIATAVAKDGRAARYKRMYPRLVDALAHGGGNCVALSTLTVALAHDAGHADDAAFRVFTNHVAPDVSGFHFGMTKRCHGPGIFVPARALLDAYAKARATGSREPFALPAGDDRCDDAGDVFRDLQISAVDPGPSPSAPAPPTDTCQRAAVLDEFDDDVELLDEHGVSLGGVGVPRRAALDLKGHASAAACFERRLEAQSPADADGTVLALGDAALAAEDAARVFALAGEMDVAREYEHRLAGHRERAAPLLEPIIARLGDPSAEVGLLVAGAGRLVALGEGGRTAMLLASERHRGFWELTTLLVRADSQRGAVERWRDKPADVQLDVIDALPCASESFGAQLRGLALPAAQTLRAACEVRVHAAQEPCDLGASLARLRAHTARADGDLCEAVLVRQLAARCSTDAWRAEARAWAAGKPPALTARVAAP